MKNAINRVQKYAKHNKKKAAAIAVAILVVGYYVVRSLFGSTEAPQYILGKVQKGTIIQTVTGSGQVSSENQLDITSEVSGKVLSIKSNIGDSVKQGDLIATLDSRDALADLQNAQIAYAKLTEPAKTGDIANAQNNVSKSYSDGFTAVSDSFLHAPGIMSGLKDLFYGRDGYMSDQKAIQITETGKNYRMTAATSYDKANENYTEILLEYKNLTKTSATTSLESMILKTYEFVKKVSDTLKNTQTAVTFISVSQPEYNPSGASAIASTLSTWSGQINGDLSSLLSAKNSIESNNDTLKKLSEGADTLDIKSQQITLSQKQRNYEKYFIRAPFEGIIGRIPVRVYEQASGGTVIATISSNQKITNIPLNEVDAVKVVGGQKVILNFDAIAGLKIEGKVSQVDLVGTASQGVVTYNVKISFDGKDARIRPGMSIDATIVTKEKTDTLTVPSGAIKSSGFGNMRKNYVEIIGKDGSSQEIEVVVGDSDDTNTEIVSGIEEGQEIITRSFTGGAAGSAQAPTIFSGLGNSQRNVIRNANGR